MSRQTEIPRFDEISLGGGIFYQENNLQAADYVQKRLKLLDQRQELVKKWALNNCDEKMQANILILTDLMRPISELFVLQLQRGRGRQFVSAEKLFPTQIEKILSMTDIACEQLPGQYRPILNGLDNLWRVKTKSELVELNATLERQMYEFYVQNPNLPLLMVIGADDSKIGQAEPEIYLAMPNHKLEQQFEPWRQEVHKLHPRFKTALERRPMILNLLTAGGWGLGSVSCGQAFSETNTFYLFPEAIKELPLARQVFLQIDEDPKKAEWYQSLIYVLHEQSHQYYPKIRKIYTESGPDANTLEVLLNYAILQPEERRRIIASLAVAYHKDVFFKFSTPEMKAYVNSSTMCYQALIGSGILELGEDQVFIRSDEDRLRKAYKYVRHQREQLDRTKAWIVPPLPDGLERLFELLGLPTQSK